MEEHFITNQDNQNFGNPEPQRPLGLSVACVLSFINAGFQFITNIFWFLGYKTIQNIGQSEEYQELVEKLTPDAEQVETSMQAQLAISRVNFLLMALLFAMSFYGVLQMWQLQKRGFHIYSIAQILMLIVMAIFVINVTGSSIVGPLFMTAIWIGIYYIYYRKTLQ